VSEFISYDPSLVTIDAGIPTKSKFGAINRLIYEFAQEHKHTRSRKAKGITNNVHPTMLLLMSVYQDYINS